MKRLIHNGVYIPKYEYRNLKIKIRGLEESLSPEQEQMAIAWIKKLGTQYVSDKIFVQNFFEDFIKTFNLELKINSNDLDFSQIKELLEKERIFKQNLSREEKKRLREERKILVGKRKEKYGFAFVDGVKTEIGNYSAEPSCIFMGRGLHPMRGHWKPGPKQEDIELNLSPDAPRPMGEWKEILWIPDVMWIARWRDKLSNRIKYVWLSEDSSIKQKKDIEKFDTAQNLQSKIIRIRRFISNNLDSKDIKRRKIATVCYLIDKLKIRVGDEKDPDEADTIGASTLRSEHVSIGEDSTVIFNFLGKDAVPHIFSVRLSEKAVRNLREFISTNKSLIFEGVDSKKVSDFLDEVMEGLSAKVFRTYYASQAVEKYLDNSSTKNEDPDYYKKHIASMANLEAAKICNHQRKTSASWEQSLKRIGKRLKERRRKVREYEKNLLSEIKKKKEKYVEKLSSYNEKLVVMKKDLNNYRMLLKEKQNLGKTTASLKKRIDGKRTSIANQRKRIKNLNNKYHLQQEKLKSRIKKRKERGDLLMEKIKLQIKLKKETKNYNLGTSLKSYIDPRIYYKWGNMVNYNWKNYYPKKLSTGKFTWVDMDKEDFKKKFGYEKDW